MNTDRIYKKIYSIDIHYANSVYRILPVPRRDKIKMNDSAAHNYSTLHHLCGMEPVQNKIVQTVREWIPAKK